MQLCFGELCWHCICRIRIFVFFAFANCQLFTGTVFRVQIYPTICKTLCNQKIQFPLIVRNCHPCHYLFAVVLAGGCNFCIWFYWRCTILFHVASIFSREVIPGNLDKKCIWFVENSIEHAPVCAPASAWEDCTPWGNLSPDCSDHSIAKCFGKWSPWCTVRKKMYRIAHNPVDLSKY